MTRNCNNCKQSNSNTKRISNVNSNNSPFIKGYNNSNKSRLQKHFKKRVEEASLGDGFKKRVQEASSGGEFRR